MRFYWVWLIMVLSLSGFPNIANSGPTISDFRAQCVSEAPDESGFCIGFLLGYLKAQTIDLVDEDGDSVSRDLICLDDPITAGDLQKMFVSWADNHPGRSSDARWVGVLLALSESLPCAD